MSTFNLGQPPGAVQDKTSRPSAEQGRQVAEALLAAHNAVQATVTDQQYSNGEPPPNVAPAAEQAGAFVVMQQRPRWLLWREKANAKQGGKPIKVPFYANGKRRSGTLDTPEDLAQLVTYDEASKVLANSQGFYTGLGFALGQDGEGYWQGVDVDDTDKYPGRSQILTTVASQSIDGKITEPVWVKGYVETSPSGNGFHIIGYGRFFETRGANGNGVEAYSGKRFFTVTENKFYDKGLYCLADYVEQFIDPVHSVVRDGAPVVEASGGMHIEPPTVSELRSALNMIPADGYKLWTDVGLALADLGSVGRGLWMDWSATSEKFNPQEASRQWNTFKPKQSTYKTVFHIAQQHGWVNPRSNEAQMPAHTTSSEITINTEEAREVAIEYLDDPWITKGQAIGFYGRGESGKSSFIATICAKNSTDYSTLWITSAEEAEDHIKLRHVKLGGLEGTIATVSRTAFNIYEHLRSTVKQAKEQLSKPLGFVVLDSVTALVTWSKGENANDEASVKRLVGFVERIAHEEDISILMVGHMNKGKGHSHISDAVAGSAAWTSSTRLSYLLQKLPDGDYLFFIRTAKTNLGVHFGAMYHTVPAYEMKPNKDGYRAALCGVEFEGERIYGEEKLRLAVADDDDPATKRAEDRKKKVEEVVAVVLHALKDGSARTRASIEAEYKHLKVSRRLWVEVDKALQKRCVAITSGERNANIYQMMISPNSEGNLPPPPGDSFLNGVSCTRCPPLRTACSTGTTGTTVAIRESLI